MISIIPTSEATPDISFPSVETAAAADREDGFAIEVHRPTPTDGTFDLFAEARQIYARARSGRRVRSSNII